MVKIITFVSVFLGVTAIIVYSFSNLLDRGSYDYSPIEIGNNFSRGEYLGNGLGKIYKNRLGLFYFDLLYPKVTKIKSVVLYDLGKEIIYMPLIALFVYLGIRKHYEK